MQVKKHPYRWVVLILLTLGTMLLNYSNIIFAARAMDILTEYNCNETQLALISSISFLPGVFLSAIVGRMVDKLGSKKVIVVSMILVAIFFLLRVFIHNYWALFACTLGAGICIVPAGVIPAKMLRVWFPDSEMQIAFGIYGNAPGLGTTVAFATCAIFAKVSGAFLFVAIVAAVLFLLWLLIGKNAPAGYVEQAPAPAEGAKKGTYGKLLKTPFFWTILFNGFVGCGASLTINTFMILAFMGKGLETAPAVVTTMNTILLVGGILSGFIVGAIKRINISYFVQCVPGIIIFVLAWFLPLGAYTPWLIWIGAFFWTGNVNVAMSKISLLPYTGKVDASELGAANGLMNTAISLGGFACPLIISAICQTANGLNYNLFFIIVAILYIAAGVLNLFSPELGEKGKLAKAYNAKMAEDK